MRSPKRQQRARQARRAVFWGISFLGMLQAGLAIQIELGDWRYRDRCYQHRISKLRQRLPEHGRVAETTTAPRLALFLGSSAVLHGLKGDVVEREMSEALQRPWLACNLSSPASGPLLATVYLHRMLREGLRPDLIVAELHPLMLANNTLDELQSLRSRRFAYRDLQKIEECQVPCAGELRRDWLQDLAFPWHAHRFCLLSEHGDAFAPFNHDWAKYCDHTGWMPISDNLAAEARRERWQKYREFFADKLDDLHMVPAQQVALRDLLHSCRQERLSAMLVINPQAASMRAWMTVKAKATFQAVVDRIRDEFGIPVLDASDWVEEQHFSDPLHLAVSGADVYSRKLVRDGLVPLLRQSPSLSNVVAAVQPRR